MSFMVEKEGFLRKLILAGFVLAMLGPWSFDLISVPAQFACEGPPVRLAGEFCGFPVSALGGTIMVLTGLFRIPGALVNGNLDRMLPELVTLLVLVFIFLPVFSLVILIQKNGSRRLQTVNLMAWVLGGLVALAMFIMQSMRPQAVNSE